MKLKFDFLCLSAFLFIYINSQECTEQIKYYEKAILLLQQERDIFKEQLETFKKELDTLKNELNAQKNLTVPRVQPEIFKLSSQDAITPIKSTIWVTVPGLTKNIILQDQAVVTVIITAHINSQSSDGVGMKVFIDGEAQFSVTWHDGDIFVPSTVVEVKSLEKGNHLVEGKAMCYGNAAGIHDASMQILINY